MTPQCAAELFAATRIDQAEFCENDAAPGSEYCWKHCDPEDDSDEMTERDEYIEDKYR